MSPSEDQNPGSRGGDQGRNTRLPSRQGAAPTDGVPGTHRAPSSQDRGRGEATAFLYPFIDAEERDDTSLREQLAASARSKAADSAAIGRTVVAGSADELAQAAGLIAAAAETGGIVFTMGNGGSATDADGAAALFATPPWGRPLAARSLVADQAVLTAIGNDIGFPAVFTRQLMAARRAGVLVGFSTSGNSDNVLAAFAHAKRSAMVTVGFAGHDGGRMAEDPALDVCFVVRTESVHRVQEAQNALCHELWRQVQHRLGESEPA